MRAHYHEIYKVVLDYILYYTQSVQQTHSTSAGIAQSATNGFGSKEQTSFGIVPVKSLSLKRANAIATRETISCTRTFIHTQAIGSCTHSDSPTNPIG